jgi:hypothetical protein
LLKHPCIAEGAGMTAQTKKEGQAMTASPSGNLAGRIGLETVNGSAFHPPQNQYGIVDQRSTHVKTLTFPRRSSTPIDHRQLALIGVDSNY